MHDQSAILTVVHKLADASGKIAMQYFRNADFGLENKEQDGFDPVTKADREIELAIRDILANDCPKDGILGEEFADVDGQSGLTWVIDPIDGTRGFISGTPTWGTLIGLNDGSNIIMGAVDQPYTGERFVGISGSAHLTYRGQTKRISVRKRPDLSDAILFSTYPEVGTQDEMQRFQNVSDACQLTRYGTDCYAYALLAAGQIDLVIEAGLKPYDIQGPQGLIEHAGGIVTDWQGRYCIDGGQVIAAGDAEIHAKAVALLNA